MPTKSNRHLPTKATGVYYKVLKDGSRSYYVCWKENGKLIWRAVGSDFDAAKRERASIVSRPKGKRLVPTRDSFEAFSLAWLETQRDKLGGRTFDHYESVLRLHLIPAFGRLKLERITEDSIAAFIRKMGKTHKPNTVRGVLVPLGRILGNAVRKGQLSDNPLRNLERGERPRVQARERRILNPVEVGKLLEHAPSRYRTVLATAVMTGARQSEILGLTWEDVDFATGLVHIRAQFDRKTKGRTPLLKTSAARRSIILSKSLARLLKKHRLASPFKAPTDYVFCTGTGRPLSWSNVDSRGLHESYTAADLEGRRPCFHDLRHSYASLLIGGGADVAFVSRQLGHANPNITLTVYTHEFARAAHGDGFRTMLDEQLGAALSANPRLTVNGTKRKERGTETPAIRAVER